MSHVLAACDTPKEPKPTMLSFFDHSTIMAQPWAEAGYDCLCIDLKNEPLLTIYESFGSIQQVQADINDYLPPRDIIPVFAAFFPPCTHTAVSGSRWFQDKGLRKLIDSLELFYTSIKLAEWLKCPYLIEHPKSVISTHWRKPDYKFHPYEYGDPYTKHTCLWVGNGFVMPPKTPVEPYEGSRMQKRALLRHIAKDRQEARERTPIGFAKAVFEANKLKNFSYPIS